MQEKMTSNYVYFINIQMKVFYYLILGRVKSNGYD
jgi:hypothetical protein